MRPQITTVATFGGGSSDDPNTRWTRRPELAAALDAHRIILRMPTTPAKALAPSKCAAVRRKGSGRDRRQPRRGECGGHILAREVDQPAVESDRRGAGCPASPAPVPARLCAAPVRRRVDNQNAFRRKLSHRSSARAKVARHDRSKRDVSNSASENRQETLNADEGGRKKRRCNRLICWGAAFQRVSRSSFQPSPQLASCWC